MYMKRRKRMIVIGDPILSETEAPICQPAILLYLDVYVCIQIADVAEGHIWSLSSPQTSSVVLPCCHHDITVVNLSVSWLQRLQTAGYVAQMPRECSQTCQGGEKMEVARIHPSSQHVTAWLAVVPSVRSKDCWTGTGSMGWIHEMKCGIFADSLSSLSSSWTKVAESH